MDKLILFLIPLLILQCFLHWCSPDKYTYKLESFKRWNKTKRFLKAKWNGKKSAFELSFTGLENDANTTFIFKHPRKKDNPFTIHLHEDDEFLLAVRNKSSVMLVKKSPETTEKMYKFRQDRVRILFTERKDSHFLNIIESEAFLGKYIRSGKSGSVSLERKDDCGCWIKIRPKRSGK